MYIFIWTYLKEKSTLVYIWIFIIFVTFPYLIWSNSSYIFPFFGNYIFKSSPETKSYSSKLKIICYYNFPVSESDLQPEQIPGKLCTHINLAFAGINQTDFSIYCPKNHSEIVSRLSSVKEKNKDLKILISIGGANNDNFSLMVKNHKNRKQFINSTMKFIKKYHLDGADIDWEWPSKNGDAKEKIKFIQLLHEFRIEFDRHKKKYILSIAAGALKSQAEIFYYVNYIALYVDFVNLMTYDYHFYTPYYPITDHNAPLYSSKLDKGTVFENININYSVHYWVSMMSPSKIILGLPAYGHTYRLISSLNHDLHAPANGFGIGQNGFIKYIELCSFLRLQNTFHVRDDDAMVPYAYNQYDWISYDDEQSMKIKAEYIINEKLGGAMLYSLNAEDYSGVCSSDHKQFPLLTKVKAVLNRCNSKRGL